MSIYNTAVNKPISTLMVFIAIMVLGVASYIQLPVDQYPKMDPPYLTVMATYPGANASDIEENVTKILEDQLNSVDNLKEMTSTSYDNLGVISLEFEWEANLDEASNDVRDAVDKAMQNLPDDIDRPTIMRFNTSMMPILIYAVTADQSYPGIDKILDDKLITRLNRVDGVASVIVAGAPERVVYVDLDPNKLDAYNLTLEQIGNKILAENKDRRKRPDQKYRTRYPKQQNDLPSRRCCSTGYDQRHHPGTNDQPGTRRCIIDHETDRCQRCSRS